MSISVVPPSPILYWLGASPRDDARKECVGTVSCFVDRLVLQFCSRTGSRDFHFFLWKVQHDASKLARSTLRGCELRTPTGEARVHQGLGNSTIPYGVIPFSFSLSPVLTAVADGVSDDSWLYTEGFPSNTALANDVKRRAARAAGESAIHL